MASPRTKIIVPHEKAPVADISHSRPLHRPDCLVSRRRTFARTPCESVIKPHMFQVADVIAPFLRFIPFPRFTSGKTSIQRSTVSLRQGGRGERARISFEGASTQWFDQGVGIPMAKKGWPFQVHYDMDRDVWPTPTNPSFTNR